MLTKHYISKHQKSSHFSGMNLYRFLRLRYLVQGQLTTNWCTFCRTMQWILPKNLNIMKTLSFQDLSLFQVKYSIPRLLLWLLRMYFSFRLTTYIHEGENTSNKNCFDIKYFTWKTQNMNQWSHRNMLNLVSWHETLECSKTVLCFSLQNSMKPAWQCVMVWTNVFCEMYRS